MATTVITRTGKGSPLTNAEVDGNFTGLRDAVDSKQDQLTSGTNIKTLNGSSLLGSGNINIQPVSTWDDIQNKPSTFSPSTHSHPVNEITGLSAAAIGAAPDTHVGASGTAHADASPSTSGFMSGADKTKLNGIATGATANATDAQLRDRSTHTGSQATSTITGLDTALAGKEPSISAGTTAEYRRGDKTWRDFATDVRAAALTGLSTATNTAIAAGDSVLAALGKLQAQITGHFGQGGTAHANASTSVAGFMSGADKTKLNGIATSATANATDAQLRDRATHTGSQAISTVTGLQTALDGKAATAHTHSYTAADVGLGNVNNTSDANKPVSTAQQTAMDVISRGAYNTVSGGVIDLSLASGKYVLTVNGNVTVSFSNAHGTFREAILVEVVYTSGVVTWPASIVWKGGTAPTLTAGKKTWITIYRSNAGTQYVPAVSHEV